MESFKNFISESWDNRKEITRADEDKHFAKHPEWNKDSHGIGLHGHKNGRWMLDTNSGHAAVYDVKHGYGEPEHYADNLKDAQKYVDHEEKTWPNGHHIVGRSHATEKNKWGAPRTEYHTGDGKWSMDHKKAYVYPSRRDAEKHASELNRQDPASGPHTYLQKYNVQSLKWSHVQNPND